MAITGYQLVVQWSDAAAEQKHWSSQHFMKLAPAMTALCETTNVITSTPLVPKQTQPQAKVHCSFCKSHNDFSKVRDRIYLLDVTDIQR
jgi:hypothetical protein